LMAASLLAILPVVILFFVAQRYFIQGIVFSGVKG
jgi:multiple sugar transport system permease protein